MNFLKSSTLILAAFFVVGANAESITKDQYNSKKKNIEAEYELNDKKCDSLSGNANDICEAEAKGKKNIDLAELEFAYDRTVGNRYKARIARMEALYNVSKEKCDDLSGNVKDVCEKKAESVKVEQTQFAEIEKKEAKLDPSDSDDREKAAEIEKDANEETRDAKYKVAKEKCDALSGDAKDLCVKKAKVDYGQ